MRARLLDIALLCQAMAAGAATLALPWPLAFVPVALCGLGYFALVACREPQRENRGEAS